MGPADSGQELRSGAGRKALVDGILDALSANHRDLPVNDLCTWVRGFGEVG